MGTNDYLYGSIMDIIRSLDVTCVKSFLEKPSIDFIYIVFSNDEYYYILIFNQFDSITKTINMCLIIREF